MEAFLKHRLLPPQRPAKETVAVDALDLDMTCVASSRISLVKAIRTVVSESEWVKTRDSTVFPGREKQIFVKALTTKRCLLPCPAESLASPILHRWRLKSHAFPTPGLEVL